MLLILLAVAAAAFDFAKYQPADLDALIDKPPPVGNGVDVYPVRNILIEVTLAAPAEPCPAQFARPDFLKWAMLTSGIPKDWIDSVPITHCIQVRSARGKPQWLFIQDVLTDSLAKEVSPGGKITLYAMLIYFSQHGPGIVINEFKSTQTPTDRAAVADCGCGKDSHSGVDFSAPEGTPVPAMDDGIVVKVERDEKADVDISTAGTCGRYVVIKRSFPNGRVAYLRYAQLGRIAGADGKPVVVGQQIRTKDKIGEVGKQGRFHFEIRPQDDAAMDQSPRWTQLYGADASMVWSRYQPVDPRKFDPDTFGGKSDLTRPTSRQ